MTIDVYSSTGSKEGTMSLPASLFAAPVRQDTMLQAVLRMQSNRRNAIAHSKGRGEMAGSTRKLFQQKGTGRARRGPVRSAVLRGGGKAFGPKSNANFTREMPKKMRRAALFSTLSLKASEGVVYGLKDYPEAAKTKAFHAMLKKMPVDIGRNILVVTATRHEGVYRSARNIAGVNVVTAQFLNPEAVLNARHLIFLVDAIKKAEEIFTSPVRAVKAEKVKEVKPKAEKKEKPAKPKAEKKVVAKKPAAKKASPKKS